jgi:UDP-glucose:(heptosyl)LPS alpha-1,3-glucosyltransferase
LSPKQWVQGYIESRPYKKNDFCRIVAISEMVKQDVVRWYGIPEDRVVVLYNGVDTERFHPRNRQYREDIRKKHGIGDELALLFVSNNFRLKGLDYLIKTLAEIKKFDPNSCKCLVLGRDRKSPYLRLARRFGLSKEIIFAGSTREPEKYYGAADILVHPTFYDACSLTVLEGLSSGLPVITTSSNGASGILSQGEDGWVIHNMEKGDQLKRAIEYFLDDKVRERASNRARGKAEIHDKKLNFDQMIGIFREAAKG